jgi:AcrR family transcriptional regulator
MGISERKEREKQEMRSNIIAAAITMFTEEGYEKTSIRRIADKIEYSPATIYLYYKDKDELLYDVQHQAFQKLGEEFQKKATHTDPMKRLEQISLNYIEFGEKNPELYDLMFIIRSPMNVIEKKAEVWTNGVDAFDFLVTCIKECIEQNKIRFEDPVLGAISVWSMSHGVVSLDVRCRFKILDMSEEAKAQLIRRVINQYLLLIKK